MKETNLNTFLMTKSKFFNASALPSVRAVVEKLPDESLINIEAVELKDPTTMLILSIFLGSFGVDRFMLGETGMGIVKLLTAGCCGILTIIDWFSITSKTKSYNYQQFMNAVAVLSPEADEIVHEVDPTPDTDADAEAREEQKQEIVDKISNPLG